MDRLRVHRNGYVFVSYFCGDVYPRPRAGVASLRPLRVLRPPVSLYGTRT